jgi:predicted  nucleic acid-binding Zn-ribbon protein
MPQVAKSMSRGEALYNLQLCDSEGDAKRNRTVEIDAALGESEALKQARRALEIAQTRGQKWAVRQRDLELELQGLADKIARSENQLYGGGITNPKELADIQAEVASLRRRRQAIEEKCLEAMIEREEAGAEEAQAKHQLDKTEARWSADQADLIAERETLEERLAELEQERTRLLEIIGADDLATYEHLRRRKGGLAVTQDRDDTCGVCGYAISPNLKWQLREEGVVTCSNCERIIVRI